VWGALYSWETAMMVDGKWTSDAHNSSTWNEPSLYGTSLTSGNTRNHGRSDAGATIDGRGICPPNWHVPTDKEWGEVFNAMESGTRTQNHNTAVGNRGNSAGSQGKAKCTVSDNKTTGNAYVNDTNANWYYRNTALGVDLYGFRVLPAGRRYYTGLDFDYRGARAFFWSSSAYTNLYAWFRRFSYDEARVYRGNINRTYGFSVRCVRD
jgi:uncharacterized protein (TIGR02145 family)